jgi:hypothetical protein
MVFFRPTFGFAKTWGRPGTRNGCISGGPIEAGSGLCLYPRSLAASTPTCAESAQAGDPGSG